MNNDPPTPDDPDPSGTGTDTIAVEVSDTQSHLRTDREGLAKLVRATLRREGVCSASISIAIVDDPTIHALNRDHLGHDWPTDVITFVLSDPDDSELSGELVVSGEMAANTAKESGVNAGDELSLYVVHGLLHLCGYDDLDPLDRVKMRRREGEVLADAGFANTFAAAVGVSREIAPWAP